ncbi:oligosaccharide flippase family protein [Luteimonas marina]|uniref:Oligosaccharide flippase family protein n=1 Tax=Luteimonas marina TaxID=488485 RepID=A0A5C5TVF7_9GAMM|nr:polysaccharide biosynthesis C-terminal domain-containing protein [Luteimonas marina]TWT17245.1 oligosaccharide flippase family protein [Luteimonas marina]
MNTRNTIVKNTLFSSMGIYTEYFLGMLTSIIIARHLGPSDFGAYSLVIWLVATGVAITNAGVASAVIKFIAELRGAGRDGQIRPLLTWAWRVQAGFLAVSVLVGGTLFVVYGAWIMPDFNHAALLIALVATTALRAMYMFNIAIAKGYEAFRVTAAISVIVTPLNLLMVLAAWLLDGPMEWFLVAFMASSLLFWWVSRRQVAPLLPPPDLREPLDANLRRRLRSYTALVAVTVAVTFITASEVEVLFLTLFDSTASAGQFKVAYQLATGALLLVPGVFAALLLPMMANALGQGHDVANRRLAMSTTYLCMLAAPLVAFGVAFADTIIGLLYGQAFAPAALVFAVCLSAGAASVLSQGASAYLLGSDRQRALMMLVLVCSLVKVALDIVLIKLYGLTGAMVASGTTTVLMASLVIGLALHYSGASLEWSRMFRILLAAAVAGGLAWLLDGQLPALAALAVGGLLLAALYFAGTLLFGVWNATDIRHFLEIHNRYAHGRPAFMGRLLGWAATRAGASR